VGSFCLPLSKQPRQRRQIIRRQSRPQFGRQLLQARRAAFGFRFAGANFGANWRSRRRKFLPVLS